MGGRNRVVGGRKFLSGSVVTRGKVPGVGLVQGPSGTDGADGSDGADGADGTQVVTALEAGFDPNDYNTGDVVFLVDDIDTPTVIKYGGKKGDGGGGGFPNEIEL